MTKKKYAVALWENEDTMGGMICPHCGGVVDTPPNGSTQAWVAALYCTSCKKPLIHPEAEELEDILKEEGLDPL